MLLERLEGLTKTYRARSGVNVCLISLIALAEEPAAEVPAPLAAQKKMLDEHAIAAEVLLGALVEAQQVRARPLPRLVSEG